MHAILSLLFVLFIVSACAIEEKPQYYINGASLRNYQGGDLLTYTVFDTGQEDGQGKYNITLLSRDKSPPINNETLNLLFESVQKTGNFTEPFLPQYFSQGDDGALRLEAIANGEDVLWLLDSEETKTGDILYPADLSTLTGLRNFTKKLKRCDQDNVCLDAGQYSLTQKPLAIETVTTPYANFEAFKFDIVETLQISDIENAGNTKNYVLSGKQWVYPLLGVVRFVYEVENPTSAITLIGDLSGTNISIDESFKTPAN